MANGNGSKRVTGTQILGEVVGKLDLVLSRQDSIAEGFYGPVGMLVSQTQLQERLNQAALVCKANSEAIGDLTSRMATLVSSVETHHKQAHFGPLLRQTKFWAFLVGGYILLHTALVYAPGFLNGVLKFFGIPLVIPVPAG